MPEPLMVQVATPLGIEVVELLPPRTARSGRARVLVRRDSTDVYGVRAVDEMLVLPRARLPRRYRRAD